MTTYSNDRSVDTLLDMLSWRRPAGTKTERRFIASYIWPLDVEMDEAGNLIKHIGQAGVDHSIMWSCHTDTVHNHGGLQTVTYDGKTMSLFDEKESNCLGADDTAGIWLMREMILAEVPGMYVFHREEECGGYGSQHISRKTPELVKDIQHAVAFDRKGYGDVITHQGWGRCCSNDFAKALAAKLGGPYKPDDGGTFTDTANYVDLIPECTNLSVGYFGAHTSKEHLDVGFLDHLRSVLLEADFSDLPIVRDPSKKDRLYWDCGGYYGQHSAWDHEVSKYIANKTALTPGQQLPAVYTQYSMSELVRNHPREIADLLREYGFTYQDLLEELGKRKAF